MNTVNVDLLVRWKLCDRWNSNTCNYAEQHLTIIPGIPVCLSICSHFWLTVANYNWLKCSAVHCTLICSAFQFIGINPIIAQNANSCSEHKAQHSTKLASRKIKMLYGKLCCLILYFVQKTFFVTFLYYLSLFSSSTSHCSVTVFCPSSGMMFGQPYITYLQTYSAGFTNRAVSQPQISLA